MEPDRTPLPESCLNARNLFARALEDPSAEEEILGHANGCLECMDAYLELKDTVKRLEQAAASIPDSGAFSTRVFEAIDREVKRRRRRRGILTAIGILGIVAGAAALAAVALVLWSRDEASVPTVPPEWKEGGEVPASEAGLGVPEQEGDPGAPVPGDDAGPESASGTHAAEEPSPEEDPQPPAREAGDPLEEILAAFRASVMAPPRGQFGRRGAFFQKLRPILGRVALLGEAEREDLVKRMKAENPVPGRPGAERMWEELIKRIKSMPDKGLRPQRPGRPPGEKRD